MAEVAWYHTGLADPNSSVPLRMLSTSTDLYFETKEASEKKADPITSIASAGAATRALAGADVGLGAAVGLGTEVSLNPSTAEEPTKRACPKHDVMPSSSGEGVIELESPPAIESSFGARFAIGSLALSRSCLWNLLPISNQ